MTKEERVRALTAIYYSNPNVQAALLKFAKDREVVPMYFEGFGKRPDSIQYPSDVNGLVKRGATSFHASEEIWEDPLELKSEITKKEMNNLRKGWDLLIDVDSPFLDYSKVATKLIIEALEQNGIKKYGLKFSGSKGFHIIVSGKAFPAEFDGLRAGEMFPEWPRAICSYLMDYIKKDYNIKAGEISKDFEAIKKRTNLSEEELREVRCLNCNANALKGKLAIFNCDTCGLTVERKNVKVTKRRMKCLQNSCAGILIPEGEREFYYCENCKDPEYENLELNSNKHPENFEKFKGVSGAKIASLDLVLVAPRHLFRMPYSLHEKTALASVVLTKEEIDNFSPQDANPMNVKIKDFYPENEREEGRRLLKEALEWGKGRERIEKKIVDKKYGTVKFKDIDYGKVEEGDFPPAIRNLLNGLEEGRKRGLFVLLTFLRSLNFSPAEINKRVREWNEKNEPPLKEGYVRSQIDWHLKQNRKILPPNYSNDAFYKDIGLIKEKQKTKNPLVDVARKVRMKKD